MAGTVHITARIDRGVGRVLRAGDAGALFARAIALAHARVDFAILYLGLRLDARGPALELIALATDRIALARGMQGFQVSAARALNRRARRTGRVFADRYRARALASGPAVARAVAALPPHARALRAGTNPVPEIEPSGVRAGGTL